MEDTDVSGDGMPGVLAWATVPDGRSASFPMPRSVTASSAGGLWDCESCSAEPAGLFEDSGDPVSCGVLGSFSPRGRIKTDEAGFVAPCSRIRAEKGRFSEAVMVI